MEIKTAIANIEFMINQHKGIQEINLPLIKQEKRAIIQTLELAVQALEKKIDLHDAVEECITDLRESADSCNFEGESTITVEHAAVIIREYFIPEVTEDEEE